jgi:hypothetical protein
MIENGEKDNFWNDAWCGASLSTTPDLFIFVS